MTDYFFDRHFNGTKNCSSFFDALWWNSSREGKGIQWKVKAGHTAPQDGLVRRGEGNHGSDRSVVAADVASLTARSDCQPPSLSLSPSLLPFPHSSFPLSCPPSLLLASTDSVEALTLAQCSVVSKKEGLALCCTTAWVLRTTVNVNHISCSEVEFKVVKLKWLKIV